MEIWLGCRDLNSEPLAPQARNINHLRTALTENKRLAVARFGRQMDTRTPGWRGLDSTRTPESPLAVHVSAHRPISEWRVIREKLPDALILAHHLVPPSGRRLIPSRFGIRRWPDGRSEASAIVSDERTVCCAVFCRQSVERLVPISAWMKPRRSERYTMKSPA